MSWRKNSRSRTTSSPARKAWIRASTATPGFCQSRSDMMLFSFRNPVGAASAASCCFGPSPACAGEGARRSFHWNAFGFRETEGQVEVLHFLRRRALEQVVERGADDQADRTSVG